MLRLPRQWLCPSRPSSAGSGIPLQSAPDARGERRQRVIFTLARPSLTIFGERPLTIDSERVPRRPHRICCGILPFVSERGRILYFSMFEMLKYKIRPPFTP
jgi:hypothetical protein